MSKKFTMCLTGTPAELGEQYCKQNDIHLFVDKHRDTDEFLLYMIDGDSNQAYEVTEFDPAILYESFFNSYLRKDKELNITEAENE